MDLGLKLEILQRFSVESSSRAEGQRASLLQVQALQQGWAEGLSSDAMRTLGEWLTKNLPLPTFLVPPFFRTFRRSVPDPYTRVPLYEERNTP